MIEKIGFKDAKIGFGDEYSAGHVLIIEKLNEVIDEVNALKEVQDEIRGFLVI